MPKDFKGQAAGTEFQRPELDMKRFRIAFSFAGEKRDFVAKVADILAAEFTKKAILYDKFHEAEFGRRDLGIYLPELYYKQSELIVVVICRDYETKEWCGLEWTAIHALLKNRKDDMVMLCRFDRATVTGLYDTAGYVDFDDKTPEQAAAVILERFALNKGKAADHYTSGSDDHSVPSKATTPNNLPRLPSFYGRADELKKIADALLPSARTWGALIDGPGGIGKTSLAIKAAEEIPRGHFKRILFLSAKEREMSADGERKLTSFVLPGYLEMLNEVARLLGQPDFAKSLEADRARLIVEALTSEQALLILDNLERLPKEDLNQLYTFLSRLPQGCKAIVTSRRRTDIDARIIRLEKLDRDAALAFLADLSTDRKELAKASEAERI
ncbi:MAG: AAA family ATPase, partial [Acidimicrobiia bacterium]